MDRFTFHCAVPGCTVVVTGIYCDTHRAARERERRARAEERSAQLKRLWAEDPDGMKAKLQAARAAKRVPATEGA